MQLDQKLKAYGTSDVYPFHMPGHKRRELGLTHPFSYDITEVDGFDNLHHPQDILKEAQKRAAALYDSRDTFYLVNGSTCGILTAICASAKRGQKLLMARNVHKAVYHGVILQQLTTAYLYPVVTEFGIQGAVTVEEVSRGLKENPDTAVVMITSPTYDGIVSDIEGIAQVVHSYGIPLIVDEAHGAHFGMHSGFPETAVRLGADLVIQSMHKTLPSLTQTALLHLNSEYVTRESVMKYLDIFETSSPSYLLMAGMEQCVRMLTEQKDVLFAAYQKLLNNFFESAGALKHIHVMTETDLNTGEYFALDPSKLVLSCRNTNLNGRQLYDLLLDKYQLQMEMTSGEYVLAMTSVMDTAEGLERLLLALAEIDTQCASETKPEADFVKQLYKLREKKMELSEVWEREKSECRLLKAAGKVAGESIFLYPPGIPVIVPGEVITEELIRQLKQCLEIGMNVEGLIIHDHCGKTDEKMKYSVENHWIKVVNF